MRAHRIATLVLLSMLLPGASYATSSYYLVTTSQATANTQLDSTHSRTWSFAPSFEWMLGGGSFSMKRGAGALEAILTLYVGTGIDRQAVTSVVVQPSAVSKDSYEYANFLFSNPVTLLAGNQYTLELTSPSSGSGAQQYFIKGRETGNYEDFVFYDDIPEPGEDYEPPPANPNGPEPISASEISQVPEPATYFLTGCALIGLARCRRGRKS